MRRLWLVILALSLPALAAAALPPTPPGGYTFVRDPDTGCVVALDTSVPDAFPGPCQPHPLEDPDPIDRALDQLWGEPICLRPGVDELELQNAYRCADHVYLEITVRYRGVELIGGLHVRLDRDLRIVGAGGGWIPGIDVDPVPTLSSDKRGAPTCTRTRLQGSLSSGGRWCTWAIPGSSRSTRTPAACSRSTPSSRAARTDGDQSPRSSSRTLASTSARRGGPSPWSSAMR